VAGGGSVTERAVRPASPLLPERLGRSAPVIAVGCVVILVAGAVLAAGRSHAGPLDRGIDQWIIDHLHSHHNAMKHIADLGNPAPITALTVLVILGCLAARRVNGAALALVSVPLASGLTEVVLKPMVGETVGHPAVLSYPSGHTTSVFSVVAVVLVLLSGPPGHRLPGWMRLTLAVVAVAVGCAVAVSLVGIYYHYFADTIGGACVATGTVLAVALLLDTPRARGFLGRWAFGSGVSDREIGLSGHSTPRDRGD